MVLVQKQILKIDATNRKAMNNRLLYMRRQQKSASQIKKERLLFGKLLNIQVKVYLDSYRINSKYIKNLII